MSVSNDNPNTPACLAKDIFKLMIECGPDVHNHVVNCKTVKYSDENGIKRDEPYYVNMMKLAQSMIPVGAEYNTKKFTAINIKMRHPRGSVLFYRDGKMLCTGCKTLTCAYFVIMKTISLINKALPFTIGIPRGAELSQVIKVQNVVASGDFNFTVNLSKLKATNGIYCDYEPKEFPGAALKLPGQQATMLIFRTGKFVLTGGSSHILLWECLRACHPKISECKEEKEEKKKKRRRRREQNDK